MLNIPTFFQSLTQASCLLTLSITVSIAQEASAPIAETAVNTAAQATPRKKHAESWLKSHKQICKSAQRGKVPVLFIGDSITHMMFTNGGAVWREEFGKIGCLNIGLSGDKTQNILWRIQNGALGTAKPKVTVLLAGVNNMRVNSPEEIAQGIEAICKELKQRLPDTKVLVLGVFPRGQKGNTADRIKILAINKEIEKLNDDKQIFYLDIGLAFLNEDGSMKEGAMTKDGLHPALGGYQIWADAIRESIKKLSE